MPRMLKMPSGYTIRKINALRERGRMMAAARWKADGARRDAEMPMRIREMQEDEINNYPSKQGDPIGCLQWTDYRTGKARKWIVRIGDRIDRVTIESPSGKRTQSHGWTWMLDHLRGFLAGTKI